MRPSLFSIRTNDLLCFQPSNESAKYQILGDIEKFRMYSSMLANQSHIDTLLEKTLACYLCYLPQAPNGKEIYQLRVCIHKENSGEDGKPTLESQAWYEQCGTFLALCYGSINWVRMSRAFCNMADNKNANVKEVAKRFDVCESELSQIFKWYTERGMALYGAKRTNASWWGPCVDEEERMNAIHHEAMKHASHKLSSGKFSYLSDLYEDRMVLIDELLQRIWQAVLYTVNKPEVESLKLAKSYINTEIHHLAHHYTSTNNKQLWNPISKKYDIMELQILSNPEMDESKHACLEDLTQADEYREIEMNIDLEKHLSANELQLVRVLGSFDSDQGFEVFATNKPDRRMAAFEYFGVNEKRLKKSLAPLFSMQFISVHT